MREEMDRPARPLRPKRTPLDKLLPSMGEMAERARGRKSAASELRMTERQHSVAEGPSVVEMKSDPLALAAAIRRHQVKKIVSVANPLSIDTDHVFTANGARYAKTGVYVPTIRERAAGVRAATRARGAQWWDKNKKSVVVAALSVTAGFLLYSAWKNAELRRKLEASQHRYAPPPTAHLVHPANPVHRTGYYDDYDGYDYGPDEEWQQVWGGSAW